MKSKTDETDIKALLHIIEQQQETILKLQQRLDKLLYLLYGAKSEKLSKPKSAPNESNSVEQGSTLPVDHKKPGSNNNGNGRRPLPPDLPRLQVEHDVPEEKQACTCCQRRMHRMGKITTEQLEYKPGELYVIEHIRHKYACQSCKHGVMTATLPPQPIEKGLPGPGLLAEVILNKYNDHLPLYRQEQRFGRLGIDLPRSTLCDWVMGSAKLLKPVVDLMITDALIPGIRIFTDDTLAPVLAKGKTHKGRLWTYVGGGRDRPTCIVYQYTHSRSQEAPKKFLKNFKGYLQADAYPGYDVLYETGKIIEVACWAHARRKFTDITKACKKPGLADIALEFIGQLYEVERKAKHLKSIERKYYRRKYSKPILKRFHHWLKRKHKKTLPKSEIGKAIAYTLNHWRALMNYLRDGILNIDNNTAERAIKPFVIGRKNWLFSGSHDGAENAAVLYSLIETCKLIGINPFAYLKDVLAKLPSTLNKNLSQLLPYNWKPNF